MSDSLKTDQVLDKHLQVLRSEDKSLSSLSIATESNGASVSGDLNVTGALKTSKIESDTESVSINRDTVISDGNLTIDSTKNIYLDGGSDTYITEASTEALEFFVGGDKMLVLDESENRVAIGATNWRACTVSGATLTEFSAGNSAYAGMILGYTALRNLGTSADEDTITLDTSFTVLETSHGNKANVSFKAPPSGNVEIEFSALCGGSSKSFYFALSDNATYNELDEVHTYDGFAPKTDETDTVMNTIRWTVTGLTAGTSYQYWVGGKVNSGNGYIHHGASDRFSQHSPPITVKAIALPETITTGE